MAEPSSPNVSSGESSRASPADRGRTARHRTAYPRRSRDARRRCGGGRKLRTRRLLDPGRRPVPLSRCRRCSSPKRLPGRWRLSPPCAWCRWVPRFPTIGPPRRSRGGPAGRCRNPSFDSPVAWAVDTAVVERETRVRAVCRPLFESVGDAAAVVEPDGTILFADGPFLPQGSRPSANPEPSTSPPPA